MMWSEYFTNLSFRIFDFQLHSEYSAVYIPFQPAKEST